MKKLKYKVKNKKRFYLFLLVIISMISLLLIYRNRFLDNTVSTDSNNVSSGEINLSPPTEQEKAEASANKNEIIQNMDKPADINQSSGTPISISITRASRTNVNTYIENLAEGTCNLSVTQAGIEKISMSAKIISQASYSTCEGFSLDSNKLDSAPFKVNISVTSGDRVGSASQEVN